MAMITVNMSRQAMNKALRAKPVAVAKQDTKDFNTWCELHGVTFNIPNKKNVEALCPDVQTALLFKLIWL